MNVEAMLKAAGEEISAFSLSLPEDDVPIKAAGKRKAPAASSSTAKSTKAAKEPISEIWKRRYKNDEIGSCKNDELKAFLKGQGERVGGKKADLVDRATRVIQTELFNE